MMKRIIILCIIYLFSASAEAQLFTKERVLNNENFDKPRLSYGYYLGLNSYDFNIDYKSNLKDIQVIKSTGFNVGLVGNIRINDFFDLRLEPGLVMSNRTLSYSGTYFEGLIFDESDTEREIRSTYIHIPLLFIGLIIALYRRGFDFIWLALLIVLGELLIVITRFIFSYEQAFMGDLVRFWYAGLFLFSSAYTLVHEGHVRVDVLYANFTEKSKAYTNIFGSIFLGIPLCWVVLIRGCWHETSPFNLALLNFEVTQQGFGMYVKYLMSGFLIIFALSMLFQFSSYIISHINSLDNKKENAVFG